MALSTAIYNILIAGANISTTFGNRIFPQAMPEGEPTPAIVYNVDSIEPTFTQDPPTASGKQWDDVRVTLTILADTYTLCETYAGYVRTAITHYRATTGSETVKETQFVNMSDGEIIMKGTGETATTGLGIFTKIITMQMMTTA